MRVFTSILVILFHAVLCAADSAERTATVHIWPLSAPTPEPYAQIVYNTKTGTGNFRTLHDGERTLERNTLMRIGWYDQATENWRGIVRTAEHIIGSPVVTLFIDAVGKPWSLEVTKNPEAVTPTVHVKKAVQGAIPELNKPVVLDAEGKIPVPEVEKTFLQKYWWILLGGAVLILGSAAGPEE